MSDPAQIHQIFMNLCTNAAQSMEKAGGDLQVEVLDVCLPRRLRMEGATIAPGNYAQIDVSDSGCGISSEDLDHIFDPYFTTKTPNEGTGLGLSVVHGIVTGNGGAISATSQVGTGSRFTIYLPITECCQAISIGETDPSPRGCEGILIVDDEMAIAKMYGNSLERQGYTVTICTNSQAALALFRTDPKRFDLVLTDMTMPHLTGDALAEEVRLIRPDIPVVLCTGYHKLMTEDEALKKGYDAFEMKPLSKATLINTVRKVLDRRQSEK